MKIIFSTLFLMLTFISFAQNETQPEFIGGSEKLHAYLIKNLRYPYKSKLNGISGIVKVQFIIDKNGNVTNIKVLESLDEHCDLEAIRLIKSMPKWIPATKAGTPVDCKFTLPIVYKEFFKASILTEENFISGKQAFDNKEYIKAKQFFESVPNEFNNNYEFIILKGETYIKTNNQKEGCKLLKSIKKENNKAKTLYNKFCK